MACGPGDQGPPNCHVRNGSNPKWAKREVVQTSRAVSALVHLQGEPDAEHAGTTGPTISGDLFAGGSEVTALVQRACAGGTGPPSPATSRQTHPVSRGCPIALRPTGAERRIASGGEMLPVAMPWQGMRTRRHAPSLVACRGPNWVARPWEAAQARPSPWRRSLVVQSGLRNQ